MNEDEEAFFYTMYDFAVHAAKHLSRAPYRQPKMSGLEWVTTRLDNSKSCYKMFRMSPALLGCILCWYNLMDSKVVQNVHRLRL